MARTEFAPMLSASLDDVPLSVLKYPLDVSPKLDGIRCVIINGQPMTRNLKAVRNHHVFQALLGSLPFDGELIVGSATAPLCLNNTQSGVMSFQGTPDFTYWVFDTFDTDSIVRPFRDRLLAAQTAVLASAHPNIKLVPHTTVRNEQELLDYEFERLAEGYEGVMLRHPMGKYKFGRSTLKEGLLMKLKRFIDGEAVVYDIEEAEENCNTAFKDALGHTKRSTHQENKQGKGMVGKVLVRSPEFGDMVLGAGTMTHPERIKFFENPSLILGKTVHWRAFGYGMKDTPKFPRFYGIREDI